MAYSEPIDRIQPMPSASGSSSVAEHYYNYPVDSERRRPPSTHIYDTVDSRRGRDIYSNIHTYDDVEGRSARSLSENTEALFDQLTMRGGPKKPWYKKTYPIAIIVTLFTISAMLICFIALYYYADKLRTVVYDSNSKENSSNVVTANVLHSEVIGDGHSETDKLFVENTAPRTTTTTTTRRIYTSARSSKNGASVVENEIGNIRIVASLRPAGTIFPEKNVSEIVVRGEFDANHSDAKNILKERVANSFGVAQSHLANDTIVVSEKIEAVKVEKNDANISANLRDGKIVNVEKSDTNSSSALAKSIEMKHVDENAENKNANVSVNPDRKKIDEKKVDDKKIEKNDTGVSTTFVETNKIVEKKVDDKKIEKNGTGVSTTFVETSKIDENKIEKKYTGAPTGSVEKNEIHENKIEKRYTGAPTGSVEKKKADEK